MDTDTGLPVGGFIGIMITILILNLVGVIVYYKYKEHIDGAIDRFAPSSKLDSALVPKLRYGMLGLLLLSLIFSIACTLDCTFVKIKHTSTSSVFGTVFSSSDEYFFGFHGAKANNGNCVHGDISDKRVRTAYAFAVINNLLTALSFILGCLVVFNKIKDDAVNTANKVWKAMGFLTLASTWCCLFTFYIQETAACTQTGIFMEIECSLAGAGVAQVFNSLFLIGICVLFLILPSPAADENEDTGDKDGNNTEEATKKDKDGNIEEIDLGDDVEQPSS